MDAERWKQIDALLDAVFQLEPDKREAFLDNVCSDDESLRKELKTLVAADERAHSFMEGSVFEEATNPLSTSGVRLSADQTIGPYTIISLLGTGGMGEVYRAQDSRLDRSVALKILPADTAKDFDRLKRFVQEAKAASALNHSNVAHIYEIGSAGSVLFIAMEYVEGHTLAETIKTRQLENTKIIDIGMQLSDALDEAHRKGIIHRDIKPANIMITEKGQVKVLDFGLAKIFRPTAAANKSNELTKTNPGILFGTVPYMSPEQAMGRETDQRSDIFSLGTVLYEMIAGKLPFSGMSTSEIMDRIIHAQPHPISRFKGNVPAELERIVHKCLEKDPEQRYQTSGELHVDLENLKRHSDSQIAPTKRSFRSNIFAGLGLALTIVTVAVVYWGWRNRLPIQSIAVMPFLNADAKPENEYLCDGITESLINSLSNLPRLKVMARATVFSYKGRNIDPRRIGQDLKVRALLTGTIQQRGDALTVTAELIDPSDGSRLWSQQYNGRPSDILSTQRELSTQISKNLGLQISKSEKLRLSTSYPRNAEAYQLYLKGRYLWNRRTVDGFQQAIENFNQAIRSDPNYALAYTGLADTYVLLLNYELISVSEGLQKARNAASKAITLDPKLAEAHTSLAGIDAMNWEFVAAGNEYRRAVELNPNYATAHQWYGEYLFDMGRLDLEASQLKQAFDSDPLSPTINRLLGENLFYRGAYDRALEQFHKTLQLDPQANRLFLPYIYEQKRMYSEAIAEWKQALPYPDIAVTLERDYRMYGFSESMRSMWRAVLNRESISNPSRLLLFAELNAFLGKNNEAFRWLDKAYEARLPALPDYLATFKFDPRLKRLRADAKFSNLRKRVGLPP